MDDRAESSSTVGDEAALRGLYESPMELAILKQLDRLDTHCRNFLAHSPFAVIGSTRAGRGTDTRAKPGASPRGLTSSATLNRQAIVRRAFRLS